MGHAALSGLQRVAGLPGAVDAAAAVLQHGSTAAARHVQKVAQRKALEDAKERNQHLTEKRQDDLVNAAGVMNPLIVFITVHPIYCGG